MTKTDRVYGKETSYVIGRGKANATKRNIGSYMNALVLLNLLNELRKNDKMRGLSLPDATSCDKITHK